DSVLENKITSVLYDFNQDVVKMYYASVAGNIAEAENNMNGVVSKHELLVSELIGQVKTPFGESLPNYNIFISGANGLKSMNQATISAHNSFTEMTTKTLTQTSDSFAKQGSDVNAYFELQSGKNNKYELPSNPWSTIIESEGHTAKIYDSKLSLYRDFIAEKASSILNGVSNANSILEARSAK
ncbi:hypothetical protein, partial [Pseudolactococcus yaeyamensis]